MDVQYHNQAILQAFNEGQKKGFIAGVALSVGAYIIWQEKKPNVGDVVRSKFRRNRD